jgi:hypothetical protein
MLYHSAALVRPDRVQRGRRDSVDNRTLTSLVKLAIGVRLARIALRILVGNDPVP